MEKDFPIKLHDNLWVLGNYFFNIYLIKGKNKSAVFEVGVSAVVDSAVEQLKSLGVSPSYIILGHPHADHITGLPGFIEAFPQAQVAAGKGAREFLDHEKFQASSLYEDALTGKELLKKGITPSREPLKNPVKLPENSIIVDDNLTIDLGEITLKLKIVKGHAPGNLIAEIPEIKAAVVSDSLGFNFPGRCFLPLFFTGFSDYIKTIEYIKSLEPEFLCPAHQGPFTGEKAKQALEQSYSQALNFFSQIKNDPREPQVIAEEVFKEYYKDEFTLYSEKIIKGSCGILIKRVKDK